MAERAANVPSLAPEFPGPPYVTSVTTLTGNLRAQPSMPGNRVDLFPGYADSIAAMTATAWDDVTRPFYEALVRAVERGVAVRLLFDHLGSRGVPGYKEFMARLDATGIEWHPMLPITPFKGKWRRPDLRNHRKILVVDGTVAFTGSQTLIEPGYNNNHEIGREDVELAARVEGPVASALNLLFATDWYGETGVRLTEESGTAPPPAGEIEGQVLPSGPGFAAKNNVRAFTTLIYSAPRRLSITSPYFVPDASLL